jgi:hypothetical protein
MTDKRETGTTRPATVSPGSDDSWLLDLVDNPETDLALSKLAVEAAVEEGRMSREDAEALFLPAPPESGIEVDDLCRMASDILCGKTTPHIETRAGRAAWRSLKEEIDEIRAQGGIVEIPNP